MISSDDGSFQILESWRVDSTILHVTVESREVKFIGRGSLHNSSGDRIEVGAGSSAAPIWALSAIVGDNATMSACPMKMIRK